MTGQNAWNLQELLKGRVTARAVASVYLQLGTSTDLGRLLDLAMALSGVRAGNILGSQNGGWGFNSHYDLSGSVYTLNVLDLTLPVYLPGPHLPTQTTQNLTVEQLQSDSFFLPFSDARLYQPEGSEVAGDNATRTRLLAEEIPARSFAVGANRLVDDRNLEIGQASLNMNAEFQKRGWPLNRQATLKNSRWLHSDLRDVPYAYTVMAYDRFVELSGTR